VKRLPPQIMPPRSYSISSGERDVTVTLTSLCQISCHGGNGGGFGGASPSSAHAMPAAKIMASTSASVFIVASGADQRHEKEISHGFLCFRWSRSSFTIRDARLRLSEAAARSASAFSLLSIRISNLEFFTGCFLEAIDMYGHRTYVACC
jgi:hypothetical protein